MNTPLSIPNIIDPLSTPHALEIHHGDTLETILRLIDQLKGALESHKTPEPSSVKIDICHKGSLTVEIHDGRERLAQISVHIDPPRIDIVAETVLEQHGSPVVSLHTDSVAETTAWIGEIAQRLCLIPPIWAEETIDQGVRTHMGVRSEGPVVEW